MAWVSVINGHVLRIQVSLFLVVFVGSTMERSLRGTQAVSNAHVQRARINVSVSAMFNVRAQRCVHVILISFQVGVAKGFRCVSLVHVLSARPNSRFPFLRNVLRRSVSNASLFHYVMVREIPCITVEAKSRLCLIGVGPILVSVLQVLKANDQIRHVFVGRAIALLVPMRASNQRVRSHPTVRFRLVYRVSVSNFILVQIVFPAAFNHVHDERVKARRVCFHVVKHFTRYFKRSDQPIRPRHSTERGRVFTFWNQVSSVLIIPARASDPFLFVFPLTRFNFTRVRVAIVPDRLVIIIRKMVRFNVRASAYLFQ